MSNVERGDINEKESSSWLAILVWFCASTKEERKKERKRLENGELRIGDEEEHNMRLPTYIHIAPNTLVCVYIKLVPPSFFFCDK